MTKSADQEHALPSSSFAAYVFEGPAQVAIRTRTNDQPKYVDTRLPVWVSELTKSLDSEIAWHHPHRSRGRTCPIAQCTRCAFDNISIREIEEPTVLPAISIAHKAAARKFQPSEPRT